MNNQTDPRWKRAEELVLGSVERLKNILTPDEVKEVRHFIDHDEYGLAFETLCGILRQEAKPVSQDVYVLLKASALEMGIEPDFLMGIQVREDARDAS